MSVCLHLQQGLGICSALAELDLTTAYLDRLRKSDRVKLHQAHQIYREGLQREITQRARLRRKTGQLERALDNLSAPSLPGDQSDEEREWRRSNRTRPEDGVIVGGVNFASLSDFTSVADDEDDDCEDEREEGEADVVGGVAPVEEDPPPRPIGRPRKHLPPDIELPEPDPEPPPEPKVHWCRLFTGRAVLRDEDGKVVRSVMPGQPGYPHDHQFINWD